MGTNKKTSTKNLLSSRTSNDMQTMKMITNREYEKILRKAGSLYFQFDEIKTQFCNKRWNKKNKKKGHQTLAWKLETSPLKITKANGLLLFLHELFMICPCFRDSSNVFGFSDGNEETKIGKTMNENKRKK